MLVIKQYCNHLPPFCNAEGTHEILGMLCDHDEEITLMSFIYGVSSKWNKVYGRDDRRMLNVTKHT